MVTDQMERSVMPIATPEIYAHLLSAAQQLT